jgi:hypothetical protein
MHSGGARNELVQPGNVFIGLDEGAEGKAVEAAELVISFYETSRSSESRNDFFKQRQAAGSSKPCCFVIIG